MRILHIISGGEVGGSKKHLISLSNELKNKEIKNIVVTLMDGELYKEAKACGIDVRLIKQKNRMDLSVVDEIQRICQNENIDIINCHGGRANFLGALLKNKNKYNAKYVSTIHSDYKEDYKGNRYKTIVYSNINKNALKSFDYYITVSNTFKNMLIQRGFDSSKIMVVYNGIDFDKQRETFNINDVVSKYNLPYRKHYVSMVARLHPVKGHKVFLDSINIVLKQFSDVQFLIVGEGDMLSDLKAYADNLGISNNVSFLGFQKPDEFYSISDFTVLTSYTESFPLSILESAYYKKPVISTNVGGISDLIEDDFNGYLVEPKDKDILSKRMLELLKDNNKAVIFGDRIYNKAKELYSLESFVNSYIRIYNYILTGEEKWKRKII